MSAMWEFWLVLLTIPPAMGLLAWWLLTHDTPSERVYGGHP